MTIVPPDDARTYRDRPPEREGPAPERSDAWPAPGPSVPLPSVPHPVASRPALPAGRGAAAGAYGGVVDGTGPEGERASARPLRFVALGDSLTEGLGDPGPGGDWRGWAALLAVALGPAGQETELVNLARSGALSTDVAREQLPAARERNPHLAAVVVGGNDTLRASFDIRTVADALDAAIGTLHEGGARVLTACLPDPGRMLRLPGPLARPLARRMAAVNTVVHALSGRHRAVHVHLADRAWTADRAVWSVDRLHPSELGHRLLAREFHTALAARGVATGPPPSTRPDGQPPSRAASARWMATRGTRWVADRATDLLPDLLRLAVRESRHRLLGSAHVLDARARAETDAALEDLARRRTATRAGSAAPPGSVAAPGCPAPAEGADQAAAGTTAV